jgi:hypothetical protein
VTALVMPYATTCPTGAVRFGAIKKRQNWGGGDGAFDGSVETVCVNGDSARSC